MAIVQNLLPEPPPTLLPEDNTAAAALTAAIGAGPSGTDQLAGVAAQFPTYSAAWAALAERALAAGDPVTAYAFARTGYHRGLDLLRRNGWRGHGPVPWSHAPNRGFLRALHALSMSADRIGETDEATRCVDFLRDCDPAAVEALRD